MVDNESKTVSKSSCLAMSHPPLQISKLRYGRWFMSENFRFLYGVLLLKGDWRKMKEHIKTRTISQIKSHAQKYIKQIVRIRATSNPQANDDYNCNA